MAVAVALLPTSTTPVAPTVSSTTTYKQKLQLSATVLPPPLLTCVCSWQSQFSSHMQMAVAVVSIYICNSTGNHNCSHMRGHVRGHVHSHVHSHMRGHVRNSILIALLQLIYLGIGNPQTP